MKSYFEAYFVGGCADGKLLAIPDGSTEWRFAVLGEMNYSVVDNMGIEAQVWFHVYRWVGVGNIFWLYRKEKR